MKKGRVSLGLQLSIQATEANNTIYKTKSAGGEGEDDKAFQPGIAGREREGERGRGRERER